MTTLWSTTLRAGGKWSGSIGRGKLIRFTAMNDGANVSLQLYSARDLTERYNMPDTLKAQHTAHLTRGNVLMSDNGRALASIVADSLGWHDPIAGYSTREGTDAKYGKTTYQELRNAWLRSGEENFAVELARNGLGPRDMAPIVNLFSKVVCDEAGDLHFDANHCRSGDSVTLRTEMDVLLLLSNTPNPFDPAAEYSSVPVKIEVLDAEPADGGDYCVNYRPENRRAFENTWEYHALLGLK
ncbi:urea amidolyase associated protein UAAP1 [Cohnella nanjingensis]|uniref:Urea carboxylase-associated family protein n=1 Tax=Cohnella nanjingensis TaxID=1387779 RepID=A0A7X0VGP5_9BACL|nr:urea amidolyase associated protein UAAP1 [Cohnella nanjingensis]MBB6673312.1 urea carboxylase-associated family protein [Cohnella nanjingensis]